jgi:hypothetical protein
MDIEMPFDTTEFSGGVIGGQRSVSDDGHRTARVTPAAFSR